MLVNADVKSLEIFVAADRYNDEVLKQELLNKLDTHGLNQERFKLPTRVVAKRFVFKLIYGATAFGYYMDSDFIDVGYSVNSWQKVIDEFYNKYQGIYKGHIQDINAAKKDGFLEIPSGRYYNYKPIKRRGEWVWPETTIKNYPIQGFGAELVMLARIEFVRRLKESGLEGQLICTVHDSLVVDTPEKNWYTISVMLKESIEAVPDLCRKYFNYDFSLPLWCEVQVGMNKRQMEEVKFN